MISSSQEAHETLRFLSDNMALRNRVLEESGDLICLNA